MRTTSAKYPLTQGKLQSSVCILHH